MTVVEAMNRTKQESVDSGHLVYLYRKNDKFFISRELRDDWLFKAYPGGRSQLSKKGKEILAGELS